METIETVLRLPDDVQTALSREWQGPGQHPARTLITDAVRSHLLDLVKDAVEMGFAPQEGGMTLRRRKLDAATWEALAEGSRLCGLSRAELLGLCLRRSLALHHSANLTPLRQSLARIEVET